MSLVRDVELLDIEALSAASTVRFMLTIDGIEVLMTHDKDATKHIIWETTYRLPIASYYPRLELHIIRTSQDLLTNQLTRKVLGSCQVDWPSTDVIEAGKGEQIDCFVTFMPKGKKKPCAKLTLGWFYEAAPNAYAELDPVCLIICHCHLSALNCFHRLT